MPIIFNCPLCGAQLKLKDDHAGKRVRCPRCREAIRAPFVQPEHPSSEQITLQVPVVVPDMLPALREEVIEDFEELPVRRSRIEIETTSRDSSLGKGFGWGFGLMAGFGCAVLMVVVVVCGGALAIMNLGKSASATFSNVKDAVGSSS